MTRKFLQGKFLDSLRLYVRGGTGGMGLPKYGGVGGKGGSVYVMAKEEGDLKSVSKKHSSKRVLAGHGGHSHKNRVLGCPGEDQYVEVPLGVTIIDEHGRVLGDLDKTGSSILVAPGGPGGGPTNNFCGVKGQGHSVTLDLKLIADIGLVGFPNAGKSSLLKAISNAKPKVASYPFTTIRPNIGVLQYPDYRQITMADLPGLIEGAHANIGMGHKFLKHVERTKMLLLIVDIGGFQLSPRHTPRSCLETVLLLNKELELYKEDLLEKPAVLVVNKMDSEGADEKLRAIQSHLKDLAGTDYTFDTVVIAVINVIETRRAYAFVQELPLRLPAGASLQFPELLRPKHPLQFDSVMAISALSDPESVSRVKQRLRELLDFYAEQSRALAEQESMLLEQVRASVMEAGPRLV
uniref:GTP-binding protein 10 n=1 Tax=Timema shepardi TaxID=629360 RepID=A0A7R9G0I7_TIMSH|nr:unnamed protein product [Timema shepardi]